MLIEESYKDVPTKADGNGSMRTATPTSMPHGVNTHIG